MRPWSHGAQLRLGRLGSRRFGYRRRAGSRGREHLPHAGWTLTLDWWHRRVAVSLADEALIRRAIHDPVLLVVDRRELAFFELGGTRHDLVIDPFLAGHQRRRLGLGL